MAQSSAKWIPGADAAKAMRTGADRGVALAAEHLLGEARKIVPHETGVLERSGRASTEQTGEVVRGAVSFDTPYAVKQHENTHYRHKKGRRAKYLEDPLNGNADKFKGIVAAALRGEL